MTRQERSGSQSDEKAHDLGSALILYFRELTVDVFAILVPGFWFIALSIPAFVLPLCAFLNMIDGGKHFSFWNITTDLMKSQSTFHSELFFSTIVISFLIGHLMFRQDPNKPDKMSWISGNIQYTTLPKFFLIFRGMMRTFRIDFKFKIRKEKLNCFDGMVRPGEHQYLRDVTVEFPYTHLKDYLTVRGWDDLAGKVTWNSDSRQTDTMSRRSKTFINSVKTELEFSFPQKLRELQRIEGHIRLHSSLWFACLYLRYISLIGIIMGLSVVIIESTLPNGHVGGIIESEVCILPLLSFYSCLGIQDLIEKSFHYQRMREIFYVLKYGKIAGVL